VVAEAGNGVEAIAAYERYHPDVTLLDLRMPVMEGVEVVRLIRERDQWPGSSSSRPTTPMTRSHARSRRGRRRMC